MDVAKEIMDGKNILLTGANGLLGRSVSALLKERGLSVFAIVRAAPSNPVPGVKYIEMDLSKGLDAALLPPQVDVVCHLAQSSRFRDFPEGAPDIFAINVSAVASLLDYAHRSGCSHFIFTSTGGVYANVGSNIGENSPLNQIPDLGPYLGSKLCGEIIAQSYLTEMHVTIFRPFFIYGKGQKRHMLLPRLFDRVANGEPVQLQGRDGLVINPTHVEDASAAILASIQKPENTVLNLAGPEILSLRQISELIGHYLGVPPVFETMEGEGGNMVADISALSLGLYKPRRKFSDHIGDLDVSNA